MKFLFWNVDTQIDFMEANGKLPVASAILIKPALKRTTRLATEKNITVINTADLHNDNSPELSENPDFINTFPPHCIKDTDGSKFVSEVSFDLKTASVVNWFDETLNKENIFKRNIFITKDKFNAFEGNKYTEEIVKTINPKIVIVYGVAANVCVDAAVMELAKRGYIVYVVFDAIKELPQIPIDAVIEKWVKAGVKFACSDWQVPQYCYDLYNLIIKMSGNKPIELSTLIDLDGNEKLAPDNR